MTELIEPDKDRCQALRPNKTWSPFALGPATTLANGEKVGGSVHRDRFWRCNEKPAVIVTENKPGEDGLVGSMSLCSDCFIQLCLQCGGTFEVTEDLRTDA